MKHDFMTPAECTCDGETGCMICDGGLSVCKVCGGGEGSLTTDCPGERIPEGLDHEVYAGELDYREGLGWVKEHNPTNQTWALGARMKKAQDKGEGCYGLYVVCPDCIGCEDQHQCKEDSTKVEADEKGHTGEESDPQKGKSDKI